MEHISLRNIPPNPLRDFSEEEIEARKNNLVKCGLQDYQRYFDQAAIIAQSPLAWYSGGELAIDSGHELAVDRSQYKEFEKDLGSIKDKLKAQPWAMWQLILVCSLGAMVQGWDEAAVNGGKPPYFTYGSFEAFRNADV